MSAKKLILAVIALVTGLGTFQLARTLLVPEPAPVSAPQAAPKAEPELRILVATKSLPAGTLVKAEHVAWKAWPRDDARLSSYMVEGGRTIAELQGAVMRRGIAAGEPITAGRLVKPGEQGFLAAVLDPAMRAVSVPINAVTGVAGLVFPGDRVDLILTHSLNREEDPNLPERRVSETVLTDVRILAIDQTTDDQTTAPKLGQIATLEVTPKQAELVMLMVEVGQLSLSLRSLLPGEAMLASRTDISGRSTPGRASVSGTGFAAGAVFTPTGGFAPATRGAPGLALARLEGESEVGESGAGGPAGPGFAGAADVASARRSANLRPYSWDSDVSLLLPPPADRESRLRRVQVLRGGEKSEQVFEKSQ